MESIFEELDLEHTYIKLPKENRINTKDYDFNLSGYLIISVLKNNKAIKRYKVTQKHHFHETYSDSGILFGSNNSAPKVDFIDNTFSVSKHTTYYFINKDNYESSTRNVELGKPRYGVCQKYPLEYGEFIGFIGNSKLVENYHLDCKVSSKIYTADTAIIHGEYKPKVRYHSKNEKFNSWNLLAPAKGFISPIKYNRGKINKSELGFLIHKTINKIELI